MYIIELVLVERFLVKVRQKLIIQAGICRARVNDNAITVENYSLDGSIGVEIPLVYGVSTHLPPRVSRS